MSSIINIAGAEFLSLRKIADLSDLLNTDSFLLKLCAMNPEYRSFHIPKRNGEFRKIEAPAPRLKSIQRCLNLYLQQVYLSIRPENVHGFVIRPSGDAKPPGIVSNAQAHVSRQHVMNLDIRDFFHSFIANDVREMFRGAPFNFPEALSNILAMITTWHDVLPVGAPTSPVISNLLTYELDKSLAEYATVNEGIYTRYADDITFSFNRWIDDSMIIGIRESISEAGLTVNDSKFRVCSLNRRQSVTGLIVNEKVNVDRRYIRKVRAILFDWEVNGIGNAAARYFLLNKTSNEQKLAGFRKAIKGRINFIGIVRGREDRIYRKLMGRYNNLIH
jgi:RNA-directed DNA polymerase